jgi:PAS domain S-box-containing protein
MAGIRFAPGQNYLKICQAARGDFSEEALRIAAGLGCVLEGSAPEFSLDYPHHSPQEKRWFRVMVTPLPTASPGGAVVMHMDITGPKLVEERLARINRLYAVLSRINEMIIRTHDRQELFASACRIAVEQGTFRMAAVMDFDETTGIVRPLAFHGIEDRSLSDVAVNIFDPRLSQGTVGMAITTKTYNVCNDILNDPRMEPWREFYLDHGYRSAASFPIAADGRIIGVFILFACDAGYFEADEIELLIAVQKDLGFAVESLAKEELRRKTELALAAAERQQKLILKFVGEGIHGLDQTGRIIFENPASAAMFGWREEEMIGKDAHELIHHHHPDGKDYPASRCPIYQTLRDGIERRVDDEVFFRKDGTNFPVEYTCSPVRSESGTITGVVVSFRNISERKQAESALREHSLQLDSAQRIGRMGTWSWMSGRTGSIGPSQRAICSASSDRSSKALLSIFTVSSCREICPRTAPPTPVCPPRNPSWRPNIVSAGPTVSSAACMSGATSSSMPPGPPSAGSGWSWM